MLRFLLLSLGALALSAPFASAQTTSAPAPAWTDRTRVLPDELRRLPVGLTLWHTPNPNHLEPNPAVPGGYVWKHSTAIRAEIGDLQMVSCGSYIWHDATGWKTNLHETPAEFAELFNCPGGQLKQGVTYTFARNYRYAASAKSLYGGDALWFIIAKDAQGRLYKGYGLIETEAEPQSPK
ncbi:hypothetical protein I2I05_11960 [Hymenobacter sp. BT683]|uniref:Uncharacterized protein n=1 Tax=Hymenobacter jeongseonensis TaxID=2791027 RepID=A0ABS0IIE8_9BACT|nr:hypothetical protein [Hymenobacter jeongseonensis]MBF9238111.1 hypothetical protein [Hymenobacter jeongseonensis]